MSSNCKIKYNNEGKITGVKDQNGNDSILFRQIVSNPHISPEQGVEIYKQTFSDKIKTEEQSIIDSAKENNTYLKAPNGQPTNLSPKQWVQVRTKNFKNWFGDWENNPSEASKVVDENGEPMVVYHGSNVGKLIKEFKVTTYDADFDDYSYGVYFSPNKKLAEIYVEGKFKGENTDNKLLISSFLNAREYKELESIEDISLISERDYSNFKKNNIDGVFFEEEIVVFEPNQIKSATDNTGEFNPESNNIMFSMETPIWVDTAQEGLSEINQKSATPEQWVKMIADKGGKGTSQQLEWIGLKDFLDDYIKENKVKSVPKEVVEQYIEDNQIEIVEVSKGQENIVIDDDMIASLGGKYETVYSVTFSDATSVEVDMSSEYSNDEDVPRSEIREKAFELRANDDLSFDGDLTNDTKYSQYQLNGGKNYREVLLTLPNKDTFNNNYIIKKDDNGDYYLEDKQGNVVRRTNIKNSQIAEDNFRKEFGKEGDKYRSSHWDEANILAHVRMNERTLPNGERVLFIEEVQSDWAQEGKKKGFNTTEKIKLEEKKEKISNDIWDRIKKTIPNIANNITLGEVLSEKNKDAWFHIGTLSIEDTLLEGYWNQYKETQNKLKELQVSTIPVPDMPYKKTDQWVGMAMRRVMQMAAQEGFDRIAWVTGEQSAERYDLSKQISGITYAYRRNEDVYALNIEQNGETIQSEVLKEEELEGFIGKELAQKIVNGESTKEYSTGLKEISGLDLKVGGEGMKTFYNSILPKVAKKEAQRFDKNAKIEVIEIDTELTFSSNKELASLPQPVINLIDSIEEGSITEEEYHMKLNKLGYASSFEDGYVENVSKIDNNKSKQLSIKITPKIKEVISQGIPLFEKISGKNKPVAGNRIFNNPLEEVSSIADEYSERSGIPREEFEGVSVVDKGRAKVISDLFDQMENNPNDPEVKKAYEKMAEETLEQYKIIAEKGYQVEVNNNEPYNNSQEMIEDLRENKNMKIFSTESGFGDEAITEKQRQENPLLRKTEFSDKNGVPLLVNDVFRFVHDFFGHAELGNGFGAIGEENAWNVHARMFSPLARRAMTTETRGQNSWVNFSGVNEEAFKKRNEARRLRREGRTEEAKQLVSEAYEEMSFAEQKVGLLPEWVSDPYAKVEFGNENFKSLTPKQQALFLGYTINPEGSKITDGEGNFKYGKKTKVNVEDVIDRNLMTEEEQKIIDSSDIKTINMYGGRGITEGLAFYNSNTKEISININNKLGGVIFTDQKQVNQNILHEYIHATLDKEVQDREAFEEELSGIRKILVENKNKASSYVQNIIGHMESGSSEEVITYMLTIKEVAEFMHSIPSDKNNTQRMTLWNKLLNLIKKVLKGKSLLEETTDILNKYTTSFWTNNNSEVFAEKLNEVKNLPLNEEGGLTFNKEKEIMPDKGIVLPLISKNITLEQLSDQAIEDFINENNDILINSDLFVGIYKFPNSNNVSLDINYVGDSSQKDILTRIAKELGQESIYDIGNQENIKTGETGENTKKLTKTQINTLLNQLFPLKEENYVEPSLTYQTPNNEEYSTFKEALQNTQTGEIKANVGNVTLFTVDSSTDYNTYNGVINGLIKSGILSGESILDKNGEKIILTQGAHHIIKTINAVIAKEALIKTLGRKNVKETLDSNFILQNKVGKITLKNSEGENIDFDKTFLDDSSLEELKKEFPDTYMDIIAMQEYKKLFKGFSEQQSNIEEIEFTPENELQSALIELLNKMGVKITSITDYITKFAKKNGVEPSASALADLTNRIVAFKDGEITTEDLSEEVAHFIVETFNEQEIENLLRNIHRTEEWQQHAENYYNIYRKNNPNITEEQLDKLVRKEILGKVLANAFLNQFNAQNKTETQGNIIQRLLALFNKFIDKITARFKDSYAVELENWTNQVNANLLSGELYDQLDTTQLDKGRFKMYSASKNASDPIVQINIRANKALNVLQSNMNNLREGGSKSELEQYRASLEKQDELMKLSAVSGIVSVVKRQTSYLKKAIEKNKDKNYPLSQEEKAVFINTTGTMLRYMVEIKKLLTKTDKNSVNTKEYQKIIKEIDDLNNSILDIKGDESILSDDAWATMVDRRARATSMTDQQKQTLLDAYIKRVLTGEGITINKFDEKVGKWEVYSPETLSTFYVNKSKNASEQEVLGEAKNTIKGQEVGGKGKKDTNWFFAHISSMVHAQDPALNMASSVIAEMTMKHRVNTYERIKNLFDKWEKLGITEPNKLLKKWKRGSYILNPIRQDILDKEVLEKKTEIYNRIKDTSLTTEEFQKLENNEDLDLTTEERLDFSEEVYEYRKKEHNVDYLKKEARERREAMYQGLSKEAVRLDKELSRQRGQIGEEARNMEGYTREHAYRLQQINSKRQKAKSPYNSEGRLKNGLVEEGGEVIKDPKVKDLNKDAQIVLDLIELDKRKLKFFKEKNEGEKVIPEKFKERLYKIKPEKALEFLLLNANISFSNEFWDTLAERDGFVDRLEQLEQSAETQQLIDKIKSLQKRRSLILKANKVHNMPSEIDFSEMDGSEIEAVKDLSEQLQDAYKRASSLLEENTEEAEASFDSVINKAYLSELEAHGDNTSKEKELDFIKSHVTTKNKRSLNRVQVVAEDIISGRKDNLSEFYQTIFQEEYVGTEEEIREQVYSDLVEYAKGKLLPYFKRIEPNQGQSFTSLMEMLESGEKTPLQFLEEVEAGAHPQIQVTPNYIFFEDTENEDLNPEYKRNEELGLPQIQQKYRDSEYEQYFGITSYGGSPTKNTEEYQALQALMEFHEDTMEATGMNKKHNKYLLPQKGVRGARQIHKLFSQDNKLSTLKEIIKDATSFREDEKEYGENVNGSVLGAKDGDLRIPKYGFNRLENQDDVTDELLESYIWMGSEAELYKARVEAFADMEAIKNLISNNTYSGKQGESSRIYKMFDSFYRYNIYGQNEEFSYETDLFGLLPKKYNIAPLAKKFQFWIRLVDLGFNLIVPLTSIFQGGINLTIERFVGERIDKDASKLARRELRKLLSEAVGDTLALNSKSRLNSMGEYLGVFDIDNRFKNSNYNRLSRGMLKTGFITHTLADAPIKGQIMMTVLKDMRVVNGDILNFNQYLAQRKAITPKGESLDKKALREEWRSFEDKTLDTYLVTKNGITSIQKEKLYNDLGTQPTSEEFDEILNSKIQFARDTIKRTAQEVDTMIPMEEKSFAQRHAIFSFFFLHRGWMSVAYNRKFKSRHINTHTGLTEEGNWWGTSNFVKQWVNEWKNPQNTKTFLKTAKDAWENADDTTKRSINRTLVELAMTNALALVSLIMMGMADDEDDDAWVAQFGAYMGYRVSNEVISSTTAYPRQVMEFIESPIVGIDKLKGVSDIFDVFDGNVVERGKYRGETERMRFIYKNLPAFKEYYNVKNAHKTRNTYEFYNQDNFNWAASSYFISQKQ